MTSEVKDIIKDSLIATTIVIGSVLPLWFATQCALFHVANLNTTDRKTLLKKYKKK